MRNQTLPLNGPALRELRVARKMKQRGVEAALQIPSGRITQYERGEVDVTLEHAELLAAFYQVTGKQIISSRGFLELKRLNTLVQNLLKED